MVIGGKNCHGWGHVMHLTRQSGDVTQVTRNVKVDITGHLASHPDSSRRIARRIKINPGARVTFVDFNPPRQELI